LCEITSFTLHIGLGLLTTSFRLYAWSYYKFVRCKPTSCLNRNNYILYGRFTNKIAFFREI